MEEHMTGEILPPIKLGGLDDGSMSRTMKSSQGARKDAQIHKKLEQITEQLKAVRLKRSTLKKGDDGRVYGPKTDYSTVPKKLFSHPRLEYVYGEIMHSPYLTNPKDKYPKAVYTMTETIKDLKHKGISFNDIPESERPYDQAVMKRSFIREVCNYNPKFNIPKAKKSSTGSVTDSFKRASTANSSILGRSTAGSSISSSATSMKGLSRTGPSGFGRPGSSSGATGRPSGSRSGSRTGSGGVSGAARGTGGSKLNELSGVKPRKHASSTSMSLDASGFVPSSRTTSTNNNNTNSNTTTNNANEEDDGHKLMRAMSQAAEFVTQHSATYTESMRYTANVGESAKEGDRDPEEEEYNDDFADPPEYNAPTTQVPITLPEDDYEQDFENTVLVEPIVPQKLSSGTPDLSVENAYNEDFETEIEKTESSETIPSEKVVYRANSVKESSALGVVRETSTGSVHGVQGVNSAEDTYADDFAVENEVVEAVPSTIHTTPSVKNSTSGSVEDVVDIVQSVGISPAHSGSVDAYADDFEAPAVEIPVVVEPLVSAVRESVVGAQGGNSGSGSDGGSGGDNAVDSDTHSVSVSGKVDPESIKLRTDLIPGNSNNNSTHSMKTTDNSHSNTTTNNTTTNNTTHMPLHHENTNHSVLSDQSNQSIKTEEHTFSPLVPSTVRSEIDYSNTYAPIGHSTNQSYNNSFNYDIHNDSGDMDISDSHTEYNTPKREHSNVFSDSGVHSVHSVHSGVQSGGKSGIAAVEGDVEVEDDMVHVPRIERTVDKSDVTDAVDVIGSTPTAIHVHDTILDTIPDTTTPTTHTVPPITTNDNVDILARDSPLEFPTGELLEIACNDPNTPNTTNTTNNTNNNNNDDAYSPTHEIDEILYTEHKNTSMKENATISNNYLNSPVKGELHTNNTTNTASSNNDAIGDGIVTTNSVSMDIHNDKLEQEVEVEPDFEVSSPVRGNADTTQTEE